MPSGGLPGGVPKQVPCLSPLSPFTYREVMSEGKKKRRDWNIMDLLASPLLSSPPLAGPPGIKEMRIRESAGGRGGHTDRQTGPPLAVVAEDGTSEFPTLPCLFTLFSWAWKLGLPTRLFNEAKVTSRNHGSKYSNFHLMVHFS